MGTMKMLLEDAVGWGKIIQGDDVTIFRGVVSCVDWRYNGEDEEIESEGSNCAWYA